MDGFDKFCMVMYGFGFVFLLLALYVQFFGIPSFDDVDAQRAFCIENGGYPLEPTRQTYNKLLCTFEYEGKMIDFYPSKIVNEEWAEYTDFEVGDYCFTCWGNEDCASEYNNILREKGVHC